MRLIKYSPVHKCERSTTKVGKHPSQSRLTPISTGIHIVNNRISSMMTMKNRSSKVIEGSSPRKSLGSMFVDSMKK